MGYSTEFQGTLKFADSVSLAEIREIKEWLGCDSREVEPGVDHEWYYLDLELTDDMTGLHWSGAEKTYGMVEQINWLVAKLREKFSKFTLNGQFKCQGEDIDDRYFIIVENGVARKQEIVLTGRKVECPECGHEFRIDTEDEE